MPMYVWTDKCKEDAAIRTENDLQFEVGLLLLVLGTPELTDKTLSEALCRLEYYAVLHGFTAEEKAHYRKAFAESVGVSTNGNSETWAKFTRRMAENFRSRCRVRHNT